MDICVICSSREHPVYGWLERWRELQRQAGHDVTLVERVSELPEAGRDLLFLISCGEIVRDAVRNRFRKTLVVHASDLPEGRGWSPHVWAIVNGADSITVTLLEAAEPVDTGPIWAKRTIALDGSELHDEINARLFDAELELMSFAVDNIDRIQPRSQPPGQAGTYLRRRTPADSELDPDRSIAEQFDLLRVCEPQRFPAFFRYRGATYRLTIEKVKDER